MNIKIPVFSIDVEARIRLCFRFSYCGAGACRSQTCRPPTGRRGTPRAAARARQGPGPGPWAHVAMDVHKKRIDIIWNARNQSEITKC